MWHVRSWDNNIEVKFKETGRKGMEWNHLAEDGE
jgi:hypothetical protein